MTKSLSKNIRSVARDIYDLFSGREKPDLGDANKWRELGAAMAQRVQERIEQNYEEEAPRLRMSNLGTKCKRRLWYLINTPKDAEPLPASAKIKFLFGDLAEELLLFLAQLAGHTVEGRQDELEVAGVKGHRDAILDGVLVDVKSASSIGFDKFASHLSPDTDSFGYLDQLGVYHYASIRKSDDAIHKGDIDESRAGFLVLDKVLGKIHYDEHKPDGKDWEVEVENVKRIVSQPNPPPRGHDDVPDGKSGNRKLGTQCGYCEFKHKCWPFLRTYYYASGPRYLTYVAREPKVNEKTEAETGGF